MKIYVDEMPKSCWECPCFRNDIECACGLDNGTHDYFLDEIDGGECPLHPVSERDKEVRKQVVEEIRELINLYGKKFIYNDNGDIIGKYDGLSLREIFNILDQVERENSDVKD